MTLISGGSVMSKKLILASLTIICLFFIFGFEIGVAATDQSLVSFSSGALLVEKASEYNPKWGSIWIMDGNPKTGWCCSSGEISNNVIVIELAERSMFDRLEFDTGHAEGKGRSAKDIIVELSDDSPTEGFTKIASVSLVDQEDNQSFPITVDKSGKWLRLTIQNNHGSSQYTELMDFRAFGKQLTKAQLPDVSGTYKTDFNDLHLQQQGTSVTGCYGYNKGLLNGSIEGRIMKFTWRGTSGKGPAVIIFTSDGEKFYGLWWYEGKEDSPGGIWNGIKTSQDIGDCPHWTGRAQEQLTGSWHEGQELEYNNKKEQANELKLGEDIEGFFQEKGDEDWYKLMVNVPGKNIIQVDLSAVPEVDSSVEIYDEQGNSLKIYNTGGKGEAEAIINLGVTEGIYYIKVGTRRDINQNDNYTLKTQLIGPWQEGQEFELNSKKDWANEIKLGEDIEGFFQEEGDQDWYKLMVNVPGKNIIQVDLSAVPEVDSSMEIYDEQGNSLKIYNTGGKGEAEAIINLGVTEGIYYIKVGTRRDINQNDNYTLKTQLIGPWQEGQEFEVNDTKDQANELKLDQITTGYICTGDDVDWYKLSVNVPGKNIIRINLSAVPEVDSFIRIYDEEGNNLKEYNVGGKGEAEAIINLGVTEGIYYIAARGSSGMNQNDNYTLKTQLIGPWQEGQEFELNDEIEQANELKLDQIITGYICTGDDQDWYKLTVNVPGKSIIRIDLSAVPEINPYLQLYDEEGNRLKEYNVGGKGEAEAIINLGVTEGIYYIKVRASGMNQNDNYTLKTQLISPWQEGQEFELNDEIEQANELKLEEDMKGFFQEEYDEDWYTVTVPEKGLDILVMEVSAISQVNLSLTLLDDAGTTIKKVDMGDKGEKEMMVRMKFPSGKYYINVNGRQANNEEPYTLRVGKPTVTPATAEEVSQALTRALDYLARKQTKEGYWSQGRNDFKVGIAGLALQAFIGGECAKKDYSSNINAAINFLKTEYHPSSEYQSGTKDRAIYGGLLTDGKPMYEHAIATLALIEALVEMNDLSLAPIIEDALQLIIRAQNTEHKPEQLGGPINADSKYSGGWRYDPNSTDSDISITCWQILALKGALSAGFSIPDWSLPKAADYLRSLYDEDYHTFGYTSPAGESCARAGMGTLGLQLSGYPDDPLIKPALRYMQDNAPTWEFEDPGDGYSFYYWYYGSRAMLLAGGEYWRIWKNWTCRLLVDHQNSDGSWTGAQKEEEMEIYTTALGALMLELCCGHLPVYMHEKVRIPIMPGLVKVNFKEGLAQETTKNVELILDASNSMWGQIKGESKISIAKEVLKQIIVGLPEDLNVGLRLYGHRYKVEDERACQDTELTIPIGPLQKDQLIQTIEKITPRGKTPLVYSILQSPQDFIDLKGGTVVLISDGIESCEGDIESIASKLKESGIELTVNIIGFGIKEEEARKQLETIAESTGGIYLDAKDSQELLSSIQQTLKIEYDLIDEKGKVKASGYVGGEAVSVLEGEYILQLKLEPTFLETKVIVSPAKTSVFLLKKEEGKWTIKKQD